MVKNCVKNGDFYWVDVFVVLVCKNGEIIGYMLVCSEFSCVQIIVVEV